MKQCAVVLNGNDIVKVSNLKRKYKKIIANSNMRILEECNLNELDYLYNKYVNDKVDDYEDEDVTKLHHFINTNTNEIISSIYNNLNNLKDIINISEWKKAEL